MMPKNVKKTVLAPSIPTTNPTPIENIEKNETSQQSADGKLTLTMKSEKRKSSSSFSFVVTNSDTKNPITIYKIDAPIGTIYSIPFNTFSPSGKYVFIKQSANNVDRYLTISMDGKLTDVTAKFYEKYSQYKITDMTGWGGINLLVVNTDKKDGSVGPSFWFNLNTNSFIQLNDRFN